MLDYAYRLTNQREVDEKLKSILPGGPYNNIPVEDWDMGTPFDDKNKCGYCNGNSIASIIS